MTDARRWQALRRWLRERRKTFNTAVRLVKLNEQQRTSYVERSHEDALVLREMTRLSRPQPPTRAPRGKDNQ